MSTLLLEQLWVHDATNLANNVAVFVLDEGETWTSVVQTRRYAGGRQRAVTTPGTARQVSLAMRSVPRASYQRLCDLVRDGRLIMVRLPRGRKLWGTVASITATEHRRANRIDSVTMVVSEVSYSEER